VTSADLSEQARAGALHRFYQLRPFLEEGVPLVQVATEQGLPLRTVMRWVVQYQRDGLAGLARKPRADRGQRRRLPLAAQQLIAGMALQRPAPSVATIHRRVHALAEEHGWHRPSYSQVYAIVRQLDPALVTLAHAGPKVYSETFDLL
jgi:putative transposase